MKGQPRGILVTSQRVRVLTYCWWWFYTILLRDATWKNALLLVCRAPSLACGWGNAAEGYRSVNRRKPTATVDALFSCVEELPRVAVKVRHEGLNAALSPNSPTGRASHISRMWGAAGEPTRWRQFEEAAPERVVNGAGPSGIIQPVLYR